MAHMIIYLREWMRPHRIILILLGLIIVGLIIGYGNWSWVPSFWPQILQGLRTTLLLLFASVVLGYILALPLALAQISGKAWLSWPAAIFCTIIRGTPLLVQLWFIYYGLGSLFPAIPGLRSSFLWPYLREAWPYALFALTISFAAYEGEVMRGAFRGVPSGELQAAKAFGMSPRKTFMRIWFPRAFYRSLPVLLGEVVLQLKATPLVATITVIDLYGIIGKVRQSTYLTYEPLLLLAAIYMLLTFLLIIALNWLERRLPSSRY